MNADSSPPEGSEVPTGDQIFAGESSGSASSRQSKRRAEKKMTGGQDARRQRKVQVPDHDDEADRPRPVKRAGARDRQAKKDASLAAGETAAGRKKNVGERETKTAGRDDAQRKKKPGYTKISGNNDAQRKKRVKV